MKLNIREVILLLLPILFLLTLGFVSQVSAQECPRYSGRDRVVVKDVVTSAAGTLGRMREISYLASEDFVNLGLFTHRMAFHFEYLALINVLEYLGENPPKGIRRRTVRFLSTVLNAEFLNLVDTGLAGDTQEEAEQNSAEARSASSEALSKLISCL